MDEFRKYQLKFMRYQYEFYRRTPNHDPNLSWQLLSLADEKLIATFYKELLENPDEESVQELVFTYNFLDNYDDRQQKLKAFIKEAKSKIKIQAVSYEGFEFSFPFDYVQDGNGKIDPDKLFSRWDRYLSVWDMKKRKMTLTQISMETNRYNEMDIPNSLKPVKRDLACAQLLIKSTITGTFPYPANKVTRLSPPKNS